MAKVEQDVMRIQDELAAIDRQYDNNKDAVIEMLLTSVMNVSLEVPRVVKTNFKPAIEEWE